METYLYMECLRNHAANLGAYSLDGCREYLSPNSSDDFSCAACGCHRSYHRRVPMIDLEAETPLEAVMMDGDGTGGRGRGRRLGRRRFNYNVRAINDIARVPNDIVIDQPQPEESDLMEFIDDPLGFSTRPRKARFTAAQREAMRSLAERLGWKLRHKGLRAEVHRAISEIGVCRTVFRTWLNNNKRFYFVRDAASSSDTP